MSDLTALLNKLDTVLKTYNPVNYARLYPALPEKEIVAKLDELGIDDANLRALFAWKNGFSPEQTPEGRCMIFHFGSFLISLHELKEYKILLDELTQWNGSFIPLITNMNEYLLFDNRPGEDYGKLHLNSASLVSVNNPRSYYDSIPAMIETTIAAYEQGALIYDAANDWLDEDTDRYFEIAPRINVKSEYWTSYKSK